MPKRDSNELRRRVDEVLFYKWDPLNVNSDPDARSEYSTYVSKIVEMLKEERDSSALVKYLCELESGMLSVFANSERAKAVVALLVAHKEAIEAGRA